MYILVCLVLIISGLKMKCDTCDSKNIKSPVSVRVRARVSGGDYCFFTIQNTTLYDAL